MILRDFGSHTLIPTLMTCIFPGVEFGTFHEEIDKKTTEKCSLIKTASWLEIEKKFFELKTPFDFIKYLAEDFIAHDEQTFSPFFPLKDSLKTEKSVFSYCDLIQNLKNHEEMKQLIKDCSFINARTFKGGLFLYCARILDSKFLSFFYEKETISENKIYIFLKHFDSQIAANKTKFPVSSIFNESSRWGIDWKATYDFKHYRFIWQKEEDDHWQTLLYYAPTNPYEYFLHECQTRYTLVRIGVESNTVTTLKRAKDIKTFEQYEKEGFKALENKGYKLSDVDVEDYFDTEISHKHDIEGNILIGLEIKSGTEKFEHSIFEPKSLNETITEIKSAIKYKLSEKECNREKFKLTKKEVEKIYDILSTLYNKEIEGLEDYLYIFNKTECGKIHKIINNLPNSVFKVLEEEDRIALQNQNESSYKLLKILRKDKTQNKLSDTDKTTIRDYSEKFKLQLPYDTLRYLYENAQNYLSDEDREYIKKYYLIANRITQSFDIPTSEEGKDTLLDMTSDEDIRNNTDSKKSFKEIEESFTFLMDEFQSVASKKLNEETVKALIEKFYKEFFEGDKYCTKTDITSIEDEELLNNRYSYYKTLLRAVKSVNINTSASELVDNRFAQEYLDLDKDKPENKINLYKKQIRESIRDILLELQVSQKSLRFFDILKGELLKKTSLEEEKVTKYIDELWKEYRNASNKKTFITTVKNDILNFNINCSDEELSDNFYVKSFLKSEISLPNTTVHIMFRVILNGILKVKW